MITSVYIQGNKVDLFKDEDISISSSVAKIADITKNSTDYSKTFTVPASQENNKLFKHYYDADIDNSFDARVKVDGEIRLDGLPFRIGKFRLSKVAVKKNKPSSYTIQFFGNLSSIKDKVGKDYLKALNLDAYNHVYDSTNVQFGLTESLFSGDVIYNLMVKKQYYYSSDASDTQITDELVNIGYGNGSGSNGVLFNDLRPSIRLIKIIEAIENDYLVNFSRDFFGRSEFTDIFTYLNPSKDTKVGGDNQTVEFDGGSSTHVNHTTHIGSFYVNNTSASNDDFYWLLHLTVTPSAGYESVPYKVKFIVDGEVSTEIEYTGQKTLTTSLRAQNAPQKPWTYNVTYEIETSQIFQYSTSLLQREHQSGIVIGIFTTTSSVNTIDSNFIIKNNLPKIKIIDFLSGLFKMFKLVVIPQDDGTIYVNTLKNYYENGKLTDVTKFIDYESYDVERGKILNEINFLFKDPKTILNKQFKENNDIAYGDEEAILKDDAGEVLDGEALNYKVPFETVVFERLNDTFTTNSTNIQYGAIINEELKPVNPEMVLFYNVKQALNGDVIGFITDTSTKVSISTSINTPSNTQGLVEQPNYSLIFGSEFSTWNGNLINNTLYKNYHEDYVNAIFNVKKRNFKYTAILPLNVLMDLELNDVLQVGNQFHKIDNFDTSLTTGKTTLNLVNSFTDIISVFSASPSNFNVSASAQQFSSSITNGSDITITPIDVGDGLGWLTTSLIGSNVFYDVTENGTGNDRFVQVELESKAAQKTINVSIVQNKNSVSFDSTIITFDSTTITFDNN